MAKLLKFSALVIILFMAAWWFVNACKGEKQKEVLYRPYDDFVTRVGTFPYTAPVAVKERILANGPKLSLEMTKQDVLNLLGEPDVEAKIYPKKPGFVGWSWDYYLYKDSAKRENRLKDMGINVFFEKNGKAVWITPLNLKGFVEKYRPY